MDPWTADSLTGYFASMRLDGDQRAALGRVLDQIAAKHNAEMPQHAERTATPTTPPAAAKPAPPAAPKAAPAHAPAAPLHPAPAPEKKKH